MKKKSLYPRLVQRLRRGGAHDCGAAGMSDPGIPDEGRHPEVPDRPSGMCGRAGARPVYIQCSRLLGAILGTTLGFLGISSAQANFLRQPRGGFPIVPIPPNMVITYELFILGSVFFTITACFIVLADSSSEDRSVRRAHLPRQDRHPGRSRAGGDQAPAGDFYRASRARNLGERLNARGRKFDVERLRQAGSRSSVVALPPAAGAPGHGAGDMANQISIKPQHGPDSVRPFPSAPYPCPAPRPCSMCTTATTPWPW